MPLAMPVPDLRQRGIALITVLLVIALGTVIAVALLTRQQYDIHRTRNILESDQASLLVRGIEDWAQELLEKDMKKGKTDHLEEDWASPLNPIEVENGLVEGQIRDLQARFNLNNLYFPVKPSKTSPPPQTDNRQGIQDPTVTSAIGDLQQAQKAKIYHPEKQFQRLLEVLGIDSDKIQILTQSLQDWTDKDQDTHYPGGAEDAYYMDLTPPYRTGGIPLRLPGELLSIQGYDQPLLEKISPYVTALPEITAVNVNTAPKEVLMSLSERIDPNIASELIENRGEKGYTNIQQFLQQKSLAGITIPPDAITVSSQYFLVEGHSKFGNLQKRQYSVISRPNNKPARIILRGEGVY